MNIQIRQERISDRTATGNLIQRAFENVAESDHREHLLVDRLRESEAFIPELSLTAETDDGKMVGHILLTKIYIVSEKGLIPSLAVAPLSVLPEFQKRGIGGKLLRKAHEIASGLGYGSAFLLGHPGYYPKFGYGKASGFGIAFPFDAPEECCLAIELQPDALNGIHGTIRYPEPFFE